VWYKWFSFCCNILILKCTFIGENKKFSYVSLFSFDGFSHKFVCQSSYECSNTVKFCYIQPISKGPFLGERDQFPVVSMGIFIVATDRTMCPGVDSACKNKYHGFLLW
jgi:hypothetical protein